MSASSLPRLPTRMVRFIASSLRRFIVSLLHVLRGLSLTVAVSARFLLARRVGPLEVERLVESVDTKSTELSRIALSPIANVAHERMEDLVHQTFHQEIQLLSIVSAESLSMAGELSIPDFFDPLPDFLDERGCRE